MENATQTTKPGIKAVIDNTPKEDVSYAPTKPQADITDLTDAHIATEKQRPNKQVIDLLAFHEGQIAKEQAKLERCEAQRSVELTLEKDAHSDWRNRQEEQITALRAAMSKRDREHDETIKAINERADKDAEGHNEIIARCKSFINAGEVSE